MEYILTYQTSKRGCKAIQRENDDLDQRVANLISSCILRNLLLLRSQLFNHIFIVGNIIKELKVNLSVPSVIRDMLSSDLPEIQGKSLILIPLNQVLHDDAQY